MNVLTIDVGGTHVKILATGQKEHREFVSGPKLTAAMMAAGVRNLAKDWNYDAVCRAMKRFWSGPIVSICAKAHSFSSRMFNM